MLSCHKNLTQEELVGWAAFYEIKGEEEERHGQCPHVPRGANYGLRVKLTQASTFRAVANYDVDIEVALQGSAETKSITKRHLKGVNKEVGRVKRRNNQKQEKLRQNFFCQRHSKRQ